MNTSEYMKLAQVSEAMAWANQRKPKPAVTDDPEQAAEAVREIEQSLAQPATAPGGVPAVPRRLEQCSPAQREALLEFSKKLTLSDLSEALVAQGIKASVSTLSRFLGKLRAEAVVEDGAEMTEAVERLAARGKGAAFRAGSLEAVRQKIFERALECNDPVEGMRIYEALLGEEERLKKQELEERKALMQERALALQEERLRVESARSGVRLFLKALNILRDEALAPEAKVEGARAELEQWRRGAIELTGEVKRIGEKAGG